jgi:transcriptional regulator with XRE-family HTH domain
MPNRELKPLRTVLARAVAAARLSTPTIEKALRLRRGGWEQILSGERILRASHLLGLARLLDVPPGDFLDLGLPEVSRIANRRLADWLEPRPPFRPATSPDWETVIRDAVRRELDERGPR